MSGGCERELYGGDRGSKARRRLAGTQDMFAIECVPARPVRTWLFVPDPLASFGMMTCGCRGSKVDGLGGEGWMKEGATVVGRWLVLSCGLVVIL